MFSNLYNRTLLPSVVSCGLLLLFASLPSVGLAQSGDTNSVEFVSLTLEDLDPDTRSAVVGLATGIAGVNATQATVDDNVASILALLTSMRQHTTSGVDYMRTIPYYNAMANFYVPLGAYLRFGLGDWSGAPNQANSYLYQIKRAFGFTNDVASILSEFYDANSSLLSIDSDTTDIHDSLSDIYSFFYDMRDVYFPEDLAIESYPHASISVFDAVLDQVFLSQATDYSETEPAIQVVDPVSASLLYQLNYNVEQARYAIESLNSGYTAESSVVVTQDLSYIAGDTISDGTFDTSAIAARMRQYVGSMMTNVLPGSAISVDTNFYFSITNYSLPLDGVGRFASNTLSGWVPSVTDPSITLFNSFEYHGITIPGMLLDLSSVQLSTFQSRCHSFAAFMYAFFFMIASVLRVRSFVEHVSQGFADVHGETVAASISTDDISGRD